MSLLNLMKVCVDISKCEIISFYACFDVRTTLILGLRSWKRLEVPNRRQRLPTLVAAIQYNAIFVLYCCDWCWKSLSASRSNNRTDHNILLILLLLFSLLFRDVTWEDLAFFNADLFEGLSRMILDTTHPLMTSERFQATYCCHFEVRV